LHQVGTSSLLIYMMHGHTYIKFIQISRSPVWPLKSRPKEHKKDLILLTDTFHSLFMDYRFSVLL